MFYTSTAPVVYLHNGMGRADSPAAEPVVLAVLRVRVVIPRDVSRQDHDCDLPHLSHMLPRGGRIMKIGGPRQFRIIVHLEVVRGLSTKVCGGMLYFSSIILLIDTCSK